MANRVTTEEVKQIIETVEAEIEPFIKAANIVVSEHLVGSGMGAATLKEIERWLTAHFISVKDKRPRSENIGAAQMVYETPLLGKGLDGTMYGQQVKILDSSGRLSALGRKRVVFDVISEY